MNDIRSLQFALDMQVHYIEDVYSLHGKIPLSMDMKVKLGVALTIIIEDEINRLKKEMIAHINSDIDEIKKLA
ncbi:MAG: hypothetical protein MJK10_01165 [Pseudomonadales bacterium]|nr:hypothetical protein [Pseudomonadales bacterium]NRA14485.1 hypothetical protein [Oceanospirillaceae bacterium]